MSKTILHSCLITFIAGLAVFAFGCGGDSRPSPQTPANSANLQKPAPIANIKVKETEVAAGREAVLELELESAGDIAVIIFTLNFDPKVFKFVSTSLAPDAPKGSSLTLNDKQTAAGKLGMLMDTMTPFDKGRKTFATATFLVASNAPAGDYQFTFSATPAIQSVSTVSAELVNAKFIPTNVRVSAAARKL